MTTVIIPETIIDGTGVLPLRGNAVRIDEGTITSVGPKSEIMKNLPEGAEIIDASGHTLIPGLIDAHVHVTCPPTTSGYIPLSDQGSVKERIDFAVRAAQSALAKGVTTQRDCGCPDMLSLTLRDLIAKGIVIGPRIIACGTAVTTTAGHGHWIGVTADSPHEISSCIHKLYQSGADFIKIMASGGDMTPGSNRRAQQYSDAEFEAAVKDAHRLSMPVVAHCNATDAIRQAAQFGADTIAHCNWLGAEDGTIKFDKDIAQLILDNGTYLDLNIAGTLNSYVTGDGFAMRSEFGFANRWELHADLRAKGAKIILTSDEFGDQTSQFPSLVARVIAETGLDPTEAIFRSTALPAFALNISRETGSIIPGKNADLVLLEGDLLSDSQSLTRATTVWKRGTIFTSGNEARP